MTTFTIRRNFISPDLLLVALNDTASAQLLASSEWTDRQSARVIPAETFGRRIKRFFLGK